MRPHARRRLLARRLAVVVGAFTLSVAGPASHAFSSALASPLWVLQGQVRTAGGQPVPNALVKLSVLPSGSVLPTTVASPAQPLAVVVAGTDGSYSIPAPSLGPAMLAQAVANGGWLNFELDGETVTAPTVAGAQGNLDLYGSKGVAVLVAPSAVADPVIGTVRSTGNSGLLVVYSYQGVATGTVVPVVSTAVSNVEHKVPCLTSNCFVANQSTPNITSQCGQNWYRINAENDWGVYSEFHTWDDETGHMQYGRTASTDIDFAFQYGDGGPWNINGSLHMGNTNGNGGGSGWVGTYQVQQYAAEYTVVEEESDSPCQGRNIYRTYTTQYTGGTKFWGYGDASNDGPNGYYAQPVDNQADFGQCNYESSTGADDGGFTRTQGTDQTWRGGLGITAWGGAVSLAVTTSYSEEHKSHWDFGCSSEVHSLFGRDGSPGSSATTIFASTE
ncbi:MAG TPA: hypothetical protein VN193_04415 [Candidatus Angelobacter sp.]|nr:hypothetical protein [Candidatus Angelobacter sp.]